MVIRSIRLKGRNILRLVDYIGNEKDIRFVQPICRNILDKLKAECLDFYSHGISKKILKKSGFEDRYSFKNEEITIPNYFEPFVKKNIDIFCAYKTSIKKKIKLFKGEGDGDRPNVSIHKKFN